MCERDLIKRWLCPLEEQLCKTEFRVTRLALDFKDGRSTWVADLERLPVFCIEGYVNTQIVVRGVVLEEDLRDLEPICSERRDGDPNKREQPYQENRQLAYVFG